MFNWQLPDMQLQQQRFSLGSDFPRYVNQQHNQTLPRISCLTATYKRLPALKRAIDCFCAQSYPNKELVIVTDGSERYYQAILRYIDTLGVNNIKVEFLPGKKYTLGAIRNITLACASGDIICQWDDDDQYHPERLLVQALWLFNQQADVCYFTDQLHYFSHLNTVVWEDWTFGGHTTGEWQLIPGTLMMYTDKRYHYPETGDDAIKGEDSSFLNAFYHEKKIARLAGAGPLYLYTCHGNNTFSVDHHEGQRNTSFPLQFVQEQQKYLSWHLSTYELPRPCKLATREGAAFMI